MIDDFHKTDALWRSIREAQEKEEGRLEHDLLGARYIPFDAYFGIQTLRAVENFPITHIRLRAFPVLVGSYAMVKKAAARANNTLGFLDKERAHAIAEACDEIIAGELRGEFVADVVQGGAGTSTNMNLNEVIANRALELMGHTKGQYDIIHPNNHVNMSQSTNDTYPTAVRLCMILACAPLLKALDSLVYAFKHKAIQFSQVLKVGRTQMQDAVPMTMGQEFEAFHIMLKEEVARIKAGADLFREINFGATAIGTGINAHPDYPGLATEELSQISNIDMRLATNLIEATSDVGAFVAFSSALKRLAIKLSKICNDLRLLSSGPRAGLAEIQLPSVQPGSSIMPGKINPVIPEVVNQVAFQVIGNDLTITLAAEAGQLQLNAFEPIIAFNLLQSLQMLTNAMQSLEIKCVIGIKANQERCLSYMESSIGLITAISPFIGYEKATQVAKKALETNRNIAEIVLEEGLLDEARLQEALKPENLVHPKRFV